MNPINTNFYTAGEIKPLIYEILGKDSKVTKFYPLSPLYFPEPNTTGGTDILIDLANQAETRKISGPKDLGKNHNKYFVRENEGD